MVTKKSTKKSSTKTAATNELVPLRRQCGAMQAHFRLLEEDPNFRMRQAGLERAVAQRMASGPVAKAGPTVIPVVVHVVYNSAAENVSTAQIKSQIKVLNQDFQAKDPDKAKVPAPFKGLVADPQIKFVLSTKDPQGKPTTGITRTKTTRTSFGSNDSVKFSGSGGQDAWPRDKYLNIWVCQLSGGLLGYAQFPGGQPETDGVVIRHTAFGTTGTAQSPFNLGRTTTHEVGHWLNLRHIWAIRKIAAGRILSPTRPTPRGRTTGRRPSRTSPVRTAPTVICL